ncbi:hypothetical protein DFH09DRAFT_1284017 [Mycena vulgaris]|nr:hypothetical protein DFH09DRAFT_1284017 [Mycena vulgaris]
MSTAERMRCARQTEQACPMMDTKLKRIWTALYDYPVCSDRCGPLLIDHDRLVAKDMHSKQHKVGLLREREIPSVHAADQCAQWQQGRQQAPTGAPPQSARTHFEIRTATSDNGEAEPQWRHLKLGRLSAAVCLFPLSPPSDTGGGALSMRRVQRPRDAAARSTRALHLLPDGPHAARYPPHTSSRRAPHPILLLAPLARISRQIESGAADADTDAFPSLSPLLPHLLPIPPPSPPFPPQTRCARVAARPAPPSALIPPPRSPRYALLPLVTDLPRLLPRSPAPPNPVPANPARSVDTPRLPFSPASSPPADGGGGGGMHARMRNARGICRGRNAECARRAPGGASAGCGAVPIRAEVLRLQGRNGMRDAGCKGRTLSAGCKLLADTRGGALPSNVHGRRRMRPLRSRTRQRVLVPAFRQWGCRRSQDMGCELSEAWRRRGGCAAGRRTRAVSTIEGPREMRSGTGRARLGGRIVVLLPDGAAWAEGWRACGRRGSEDGTQRTGDLWVWLCLEACSAEGWMLRRGRMLAYAVAAKERRVQSLGIAWRASSTKRG